MIDSLSWNWLQNRFEMRCCLLLHSILVVLISENEAFIFSRGSTSSNLQCRYKKKI